MLDVCNALRVRAAIDIERSGMACVGRLCCVNVCIKLFGIAFHGDCVMSCRVWCSRFNAIGVGSTKENLYESLDMA